MSATFLEASATETFLFNLSFSEWSLSLSGVACGATVVVGFPFEHIPFLRKQAFVEECRSQVGEQQDGGKARQHGDGLHWSVLDIDTVLHSAPWEM